MECFSDAQAVRCLHNYNDSNLNSPELLHSPLDAEETMAPRILSYLKNGPWEQIIAGVTGL